MTEAPGALPGADTKENSMITNYQVTGMTCGNCVNHVTEEVSEVEGVKNVNVTLEGGQMAVESDAPIAFTDIQAAVAEAGDKYAVTQA
ncbi:heavy-metal-associated domain-containing protein [Tessaracoccus sp. OS52]|uniref:heavy-metal-associated domain-containing protein n=1 Tax=Tessaracoccus sp. OS52 TaxID=2886691 RepID=UPI001D116AAE|nr:heavy metal-associated domain-containing protein [Tessaracoccus sp. OS52]MCC2594678.1 heavy-metal-associated domain-containing protein [Tessaracoccus sp. OS52]